MKTILIFIIAFSSIIYSQQHVIKGKITDRTNLEPLSFANVRIADSFTGTAANLEGRYELRLPAGSYKIIFSFIGYNSDTVKIELNSDKTINVALEPTSINLPEVTVLPGENPALEIIRRAIEAKHARNKILNSYEFNAYTKGTIKTTGDFTSSGTSVGVSVGTGKKDTADLKITGIIENESKGYYKKPNQYKDEIIARKQSANMPSQINILTGGRALQNFYTDDIRFFNRPLLSPIADDALDYYDYLIEDTLAMDKQNVFRIKFEPLDKYDPGFFGSIYISDKSYSLVKLDVNLNDAANPGRIFNKINILQQFTSFGNNIVMPADYRVFAEGSFLGLVNFGFELNSIFYDYKINNSISDDLFGMAIVKVLSDADTKDTLYWKSIQTIPNTLEELQAYRRIDSIEAVTKDFGDNFSLLSSTINLDKNYSITGPLGLYSFNKIEGHILNFEGTARDLFNRRFYASLDLSYGFADKKFKTDLSATYYLGEYRTASVTVSASDKLVDLFSESIRFSKLTSTFTNIFYKYDFRDYHYTKGFSVNALSEVFPVFRLGAGFINRTDNNAFNNTNFSIFKRSKNYSINKTIYETKIKAVTASFRLDFRKYIEDGYFRRRTSQGNAYAFLSGNALFSNSSMLKSSLSFQSYKLSLNGYIPTYKSSSMNFIFSGIYSNGPVPYQMLYSLPGSIEMASPSFSFRTIRTGEVFGDRALILSIEQNFNDELFRTLGLNFLIDLQINLSAHFNAALLEVSPDSKSIFPKQNNPAPVFTFTEFKKPFAELGFGLGHALFPIRFEFTWKLNYFGKNNFVLGMNTPML